MYDWFVMVCQAVLEKHFPSVPILIVEGQLFTP